jgi:hypothetical protein
MAWVIDALSCTLLQEETSQALRAGARGCLNAINMRGLLEEKIIEIHEQEGYCR